MIALIKQRKKLALTLRKQKSLHYDGVEIYLYLNKTEICKFKVPRNTFWC